MAISPASPRSLPEAHHQFPVTSTSPTHIGRVGSASPYQQAADNMYKHGPQPGSPGRTAALADMPGRSRSPQGQMMGQSQNIPQGQGQVMMRGPLMQQGHGHGSFPGQIGNMPPDGMEGGFRPIQDSPAMELETGLPNRTPPRGEECPPKNLPGIGPKMPGSNITVPHIGKFYFILIFAV